MKLIFCYGEEFITDLIISTDLDYLCLKSVKKYVNNNNNEKSNLLIVVPC